MKFRLLLSIILGILFFHVSETNAQWVKTNQAYGGSIQCLVSSGSSLPSGQASIFAGTWMRGIFLSTNNGTSWTAVNNGLPSNCNVRSLAVTPVGTSSKGMDSTNLPTRQAGIFAGTLSYGVYLSTDNGSKWNAVNSGLPASANIYCLTISPAPDGRSAANIFAGTSSNGVYLSTDNGSSWSAVNSGLSASAAIYSLTVSGINIFAGTRAGGIFLSTNNGSSWTNCGLKGYSIVSLSASDSIIFAAYQNSIGGGGIFFSTDNGITWNKTSFNSPNIGAVSVSVHGTSSILGQINLFAGTSDGFLYQSTDKGTNWYQVNTGWTVKPVISAICQIDTSSNILVGTRKGVYLSTDNGNSWIESNTGLTGLLYYSLCASPTATNSIGTSGTNLFAGTNNGVFISTDDGSGWQEINAGFLSSINQDASYIAVSPDGTKGADIFAAGDDNVYLSTNNGTSWNPIGTSANLGLASLATFSAGNNITYLMAGSSSYYGLFRFSNNGLIWSSWSYIDTGWISKFFVYSFAGIGRNLFAGTSGGVFVSTDNGLSWSLANKGLTSANVPALAVSPGNRDTSLFAGTSNGVCLSTDNGSSWNAVNSGLSSMNVYALSVCGSNIFAGTYGSVFLSTNNGMRWTEINTGLPLNFLPMSLVISGMYIIAATQNGIWRRPLSELIPSAWQADINIKDNANTSQSLTFGESPIATDSIDAGLGEAPLPPAAFGFDARFHLPNGVDSWKDYRSADKDSDDWVIIFQPGDGGYPITFTWDNLKLPAGNFYLKDNINGTFVNVNMKTSNSYTLTNTGISELQIQTTGLPTTVETKADKVLPDIYSLSQNYPNPFNPSTVLRYGLPGISNVKIKIYNLLGQEVESLVNDMQSAGYHEIVWNASNKASGVYFYSIDANSIDGKEKFSAAKKMILLK